MQHGRLERSWKRKSKSDGTFHEKDITSSSSEKKLGQKEIKNYNWLIGELRIYESLNKNSDYSDFVKQKNPTPKDYQNLKKVYYQITNHSLNPEGDLEKIVKILKDQ